MPELPEVETVRRGLVPVMEGQRIAQVILNRPDLRRPFPAGMAERLTGARVRHLSRRAKYLLAALSTDATLLLHLGMSGRILIAGAGETWRDPAVHTRHDHVVIGMANGTTIIFNDARRFGLVDLVADSDLATHPLLAGLGPEPLGNAFDDAYLQQRLGLRRGPVKAALLDQHLVAGLGNIYVCEALHRARIHPARPAASLEASQIGALVAAIREVLEKAIAAGGSSLRDYRKADGGMGYFQHSFHVYGREGLDCPRPGCAGRVVRIAQSGRSSFFCPDCQI